MVTVLGTLKYCLILGKLRLILFWAILTIEGSRYGCLKIVISNGLDCGSAEWINYMKSLKSKYKSGSLLPWHQIDSNSMKFCLHCSLWQLFISHRTLSAYIYIKMVQSYVYYERRRIRHVSSMIPSARPTVPPVAIIIFMRLLFCDIMKSEDECKDGGKHVRKNGTEGQPSASRRGRRRRRRRRRSSKSEKASQLSKGTFGITSVEPSFYSVNVFKIHILSWSFNASAWTLTFS